MTKWAKTKLRNITTKIGSGATPTGGKGAYKKEGISLIRSLNVYDFSFSYKDLAFIDDKQAKKLNNVMVVDKDVLLNITGASVARCCIVPKDILPARVNQHVSIIRTDKINLDAKYLYYSLVSPIYKNELLSIAQVGATREALTKERIEEFEILIPADITIQHKIASILSNYDDLIENNAKRIKILEEMAQKIYKEWFVNFRVPGYENVEFEESKLGRKPKGWEVKQLSAVINIHRGKSYKSTELSEKLGLPFLNLKNINRCGGFRRDGLKWFTGKYQEHHITNPEEIIMAITDMTQERGIVARCARIPSNWHQKYIISMDLVRILPKQKGYSDYIYSLLKFSNFADKTKIHANGANVLHLNPKSIENFSFIYPKDNLIVQYNNLARDIFNLIDNYQLKNDILSKTRDLLLPKLISGEIDVENLEIKV